MANALKDGERAVVAASLSRRALGDIAQRVMHREAEAVHAYADVEDPALVDAAYLIHASRGPLIIAGIGKSGHIAQKVASTFRSLGHPAVYLHAAEASHGDLGLVQEDSAVLVLSNSGETSELSDLLAFCRENDNPVIGMTATSESTLAHMSRVVIAYGRQTEACVNELAPTTTTTLSLAIGDALAVMVSALGEVQPEDFRRFHPGGKLGARLATVGQAMRAGHQVPSVGPATPMTEVFAVISEKAIGIAVVLEEDRALGVITDGDIRRHAETLWKSVADDIATSNPVRVRMDMRLTEAIALMNEQGITACVVETPDGGMFAGVLHIHDALALAGGA